MVAEVGGFERRREVSNVAPRKSGPDPFRAFGPAYLNQEFPYLWTCRWRSSRALQRFGGRLGPSNVSKVEGWTVRTLKAGALACFMAIDRVADGAVKASVALAYKIAADIIGFDHDGVIVNQLHIVIYFGGF